MEFNIDNLSEEQIRDLPIKNKDVVTFNCTECGVRTSKVVKKYKPSTFLVKLCKRCCTKKNYLENYGTIGFLKKNTYNVNDFTPMQKAAYLSMGDYFEFTCEQCGCSTKRKVRSDRPDTFLNFVCESCRRKNTTLERFGAENISQVKSPKESLKRRWSISKEEILNKRANTSIERFGVPNYQNVKSVKEKQSATKIKNNVFEKSRVKKEQTCLKLYGNKKYTNPKKAVETKKNKIKNFESLNNVINLTRLMNEIGQGFLSLDFKRIYDSSGNCYLSHEDELRCREYAKTNHNLKSVSSSEKDILDFVKGIYKGNVLENVRGFIKGYELDILIPDLKVAIEFNGSYWHSTSFLKKDYHLNKTLMCKEKGVRLIHIFEYDWIHKRPICESIIRNAVSPNTLNIIYARKCTFQKVEDYSLYKRFLNENHLQGFVTSKDVYGLYYNGELVELISFGNICFRKSEIELLRSCTKIGYKVIGGFSKLIKNSGFNNFISYVDRATFTGDSYLRIGFKLVSESEPSYFYVGKQNTVKYNRISCQKYKLPKLLGEQFDESLTETENMLKAGYFKVYDCGTFKMYYNID